MATLSPLNLRGLSASDASHLLRDAVAQGEGLCLEFKSSFQKEVIESLTAFANSQGGSILIGVSDVEKIKTGNYKSYLRNKQIASIFKELELIEKYGSGVRRVIDAFVAYGLPEPTIEATQGGMAVTVFKETAKAALDSMLGGVNEGVNSLLGGFKHQVQITQRDAA
jgi:predicted HTH transcriptional regulator